ncbi:MAG: EF-P lysine aminoacylase GenX [Alphaproteobacteria bacterium]|nr:EF-P lysine aminoacylase GenX [Alphaproteobacteria bacterium]
MRQSWWRPDRYALRRPALLARGRIAQATRRYFQAQDFVEVETPALQVSPGMEPHLKAFATRLTQPDGASDRLYLHTSPEFAMKKLLVAGEPRLFQFARVFRDGERADTHHPEFTMLEWYRADQGYERLMADCQDLLRGALVATGRERFHWRGQDSDPGQPWQRLSVAEAFHRHAGFDLLATIDRPDAPEPGRLAEQARAAGVRVADGDGWDDLFFRIFLERIEPGLGHPVPTLLCDYPIHMAALSRPKPGAPHLAERFELYVCGLELANAFGELTDPVEQRRRFQADQELKRRLYGVAYPIDEDFLAALAFGMPPAAGIALGFDRLVMLATGANRIEDVLWAPVAPHGS